MEERVLDLETCDFSSQLLIFSVITNDDTILVSWPIYSAGCNDCVHDQVERFFADGDKQVNFLLTLHQSELRPLTSASLQGCGHGKQEICDGGNCEEEAGLVLSWPEQGKNYNLLESSHCAKTKTLGTHEALAWSVPQAPLHRVHR